MEKRCAETSPGENTVGYADGSEECSRKKWKIEPIKKKAWTTMFLNM